MLGESISQFCISLFVYLVVIEPRNGTYVHSDLRAMSRNRINPLTSQFDKHKNTTFYFILMLEKFKKFFRIQK